MSGQQYELPSLHTNMTSPLCRPYAAIPLAVCSEPFEPAFQEYKQWHDLNTVWFAFESTGVEVKSEYPAVMMSRVVSCRNPGSPAVYDYRIFVSCALRSSRFMHILIGNQG